MRKIIYTILSLAIISGCAKRGSPTGGPIDSIPPVLVNANPKLNSTNFDSEEIRLTFDEFVKLDKVQDQLIISPPVEKSGYEIKPLTGVTKKVFLKFIDTLDINKAQNIVSIDLKDKSSMADYMIIASGTSSRHIQSLSEQVLEELKNSGLKDSKIEGKDSSEWKLVDGIDLIVHIFHPEKRKFYELEKMWSELIPKEKLII